jgi:hypothetical protein
VAASVKISIKRNLKVYIDEKSSTAVDYFTMESFLSKAESGIERSTINMNVIIVIVPQKKEIRIASFLLTS